MAIRLKDDGTVLINSETDILECIKEFLPSDKEQTTMSTNIMINGQRKKLVAKTNMSNRGMLMEGFDIIRARLEAKEKYGEGMVPVFNTEGRMWLDDLIARRLGGVRDGLRVKWDIGQVSYFFDPYDGRLTKKTNK